MRYYQPVVQKQYRRGAGHCCSITRKHYQMEGEGILQDLIYEGVSLAKKYITPENLRYAGNKVLSILKAEGEDFVRKTATTALAKGGKKAVQIADDLIKGKTIQDIGKETKKDLREAYSQVSADAPKALREAVNKAEAKVVEEFLAPPPTERLSDVIGSGMMKHKSKSNTKPKTKRQRGKGMKRV